VLARRRYYYRAYERRFAVLFWFMVLGPAGAIAYRGAALESAQPAAPGGIRLLHWLDWIPVRLLGISYALVGDFDACLYRWRGLLDDTRTPAELALETCGYAALRQHERADAAEETTDALIARGAAELDAVEVMHRRALLVWMVVIALLTMIG
jgi:AmpE protein